MSTSKRINLFFVFGFLIGAVLITTIFSHLRNDQENHIRTQVKETGEAMFHEIRWDMALTTQALYEIKGLYENSEFITRDEFGRLARSILSRRSGIQALEWIPRVPKEKRAAYEERARREGFPGFAFTKRKAQGEMTPDGDRTEYFPVYYMEPYTGNEAALGFSLGSRPDRLKALEKARRTGRPVATEVITLVQGTAKQKGFLIFLPVYKEGSENDENFMGFALGVFRIGDMIEAVLPDPVRDGELEMRFYDITESPAVALYQSSLPDKTVISPAFGHTATLHIADRQWRIQTRPTKDFIARHRPPYPYWILTVGFATLLFLLYTAISRTLQFEALQKLHSSLGEAEKVGHIGRFTITLPDNKMWMSGEMLEAYGLDESKLPVTLEWALRRVHPDDVFPLRANLEQLLADNTPHETEMRIRTNETEVKVIRTRGKVEYDKNGTPLRIIGIARDVTEEREREKALHFNEEYLRAIFDTEPDILITTDSDKIDRGNARMLEFTGYPDIESFKKDYDCICDLFEKREGYLQRDMDGQNWLEYIYAHTDRLHKAIIKKEGEEHIFLINATPLVLEEIKLDIVVLSDITRVEAANKAVQESTRKFRDLVESINDWMWEVDAQGRYTYASPRCREMLGYEPEEILGKSPFDLMPPDEAEKIAGQFGAIVSQKAPIKNLINRALHKSGREVVLETSGIPLMDENGNLTGYRGVDRDITDRILAEETLKEEQVRTELYLRTAQVMLMALDRDGTITMINPRGCEILGAAEEELVGTNWFKCCIPHAIGDEMQDVFVKCMKGEETLVGEYDNEILRKDGAIRLIHWRNAQLKNASGEIIGVLSSGEDVTERRRAEERLKLFRTLLDNSGDAIEVIEPGTMRFLDVNETECRALGYSREELLAMTVLDIDPKFTPEIGEIMMEQMGKSGSASHEGIHRRKDGSIFPVEISATMIELDKSYVLSIARDITERKEAEAALNRAMKKRQELEFIINHSPAVVFLWRAEEGWPVEYVSESISQFGYTPDDFYSGRLPYATIVHPDDLERVGNEVVAFGKEGKTQFSQEYRILSPEGEVFTIDDRTWLRRGDDGEITHYQGIIMDITERKAAKAALEESEDRFKAIFDNAGDGILLADPASKKLITGNAKICEMLGYTPEELTALSVTDMHPQKDIPYVLSQFEKQAKKETALAAGLPVQRKDGSVFYADVNSFSLTIGGKAYLAGFFRDITERKKMEESLRQKEEMMLAQSRQAAMGDMIAMIAHQWRQPITVIAMAANNIKLGIELEEELTADTLLQMTETVTEQTQHLSKTIDDFRNFFKPNKEKVLTTVAAVLESTIQIIGKSLENNNIAVTMENRSSTQLFTFPNELLQVFLNIINNAKDILKGRDDARIAITVDETDKAIVSTICDNGGGIPKNVIRRIGEPYFTTKIKSGTGLGLYMSKTIIEQHLGGTLTWENRDRGACFIITIDKE